MTEGEELKTNAGREKEQEQESTGTNNCRDSISNSN